MLLVVLRALTIRSHMWQQWVNALLGLWVVAVPFLGFTEANMMWALVITGIAIAVLALWGGAYEQSTSHRRDFQHRAG